MQVFDGDTILLALEPEAAAVHYIQDTISPKQSKHYLLVDCGGGTIDIVAHKMQKNENGEISIAELVPPQGSSSGSFEINYEFENLLCKLFNLNSYELQEVKTMFPEQWEKMIFDEFEEAKQQTNPTHTHRKGVIEIKERMITYFKEKLQKSMEDIVTNYKDHKVNWDSKYDKLILPYATMYSLFQPTISRISLLIEEMLQKSECSEISEIILVGGFASNELLYQQLKSHFPSKAIELRTDASVAVLKGAIKYGANTKQIESRKMPLSIGIETCVPFVEGVHDKQREITIKGKQYCHSIFFKCIGINETIVQGKVFEQVFEPQEDAPHCNFIIYGTESMTHSTMYVTDQGCYTIAHCVISDINHLPQRIIKIIVDCSGTEMKVSACSATNEEIKLPVKFVDEAHDASRGLITIGIQSV